VDEVRVVGGWQGMGCVHDWAVWARSPASTSKTRSTLLHAPQEGAWRCNLAHVVARSCNVTVEPPEDRARKIVSSILKATQRDASQTAIAAAMGVSESTVSRLLSDHLDKLALVMAHAGLRVVGQDMRCFPPDYVDALLLMAKQHLSAVQTVRTLEWD